MAAPVCPLRNSGIAELSKTIASATVRLSSVVHCKLVNETMPFQYVAAHDGVRPRGGLIEFDDDDVASAEPGERCVGQRIMTLPPSMNVTR